MSSESKKDVEEKEKQVDAIDDKVPTEEKSADVLFEEAEEELEQELERVKNDTKVLDEQRAEDTVEEKEEFLKDDTKSEPLQRLKRLAQYFKKPEKRVQKQKIEEPSPESKESQIETTQQESSMNKVVESILRPKEEVEAESRRSFSFEDFVDERTLISRDVLDKKEMKIKVLEVSDEHPPLQWKFGDRVKVSKILVTIKHLDTQEVEEAEFDIEAIENELIEKRHYTSTNRWIPTNEIKNGYVIGPRHTSLISDAVALDYIQF